MKPFLKRELGWAPWICNLIFFSNLIEQALPSGQRNYIAADSSIDVLLGRLCLSRKLTASQAKNYAAIFTCIPAVNDEERSIRNEQLKNLSAPNAQSRSRPVPCLPYATVSMCSPGHLSIFRNVYLCRRGDLPDRAAE